MILIVFREEIDLSQLAWVFLGAAIFDKGSTSFEDAFTSSSSK